MADYYKTSATIRVPEPEHGKPKKKPPVHRASPEKTYAQPAAHQQPSAPLVQKVEPFQHPLVQHQKPAAYEPTGYIEPIDAEPKPKMTPAGVNPKLKNRCMSCDVLLRRLLPLILLFVYWLLGGGIFHLTERNDNQDTILYGQKLKLPPRPQFSNTTRMHFVRRCEEIAVDQALRYTRSERKRELDVAVNRFMSEVTEQWKILDKRWQAFARVDERKWNFDDSLFYAMQLFTTIGYGNIAPVTTAGKVWTVFYSLIGIPLCLMALVQLGYIIAFSVSKLWRCIRHGATVCTGRRRQRPGEWQAVPASPNDVETQYQEEQEDVDLLSFPLSALVLLTLLWLLFTALLFYAWQHGQVASDGQSASWSYAESLYFCFISFTTIGLGDYTPTTASGKLGGILFLLIGLALLSTTFAVLQQQLEALQHSMQRSIDVQYQEAQTETGEPMAMNDEDVDANLKKMASRLPLGSRCLFWLMPESNKQSLKKYYAQKAAMASKNIQTDDYIWAMTTMSRSFLKNIEEEDPVRAQVLDDTKSRDDVNSLMAMVDYSLKQ